MTGHIHVFRAMKFPGARLACTNCGIDQVQYLHDRIAELEKVLHWYAIVARDDEGATMPLDTGERARAALGWSDVKLNVDPYVDAMARGYLIARHIVSDSLHPWPAIHAIVMGRLGHPTDQLRLLERVRTAVVEACVAIVTEWNGNDNDAQNLAAKIRKVVLGA